MEAVNIDLLGACRESLRFIESLRVPQDISDAALQVIFGNRIIERLHRAIDRAEAAELEIGALVGAEE